MGFRIPTLVQEGTRQLSIAADLLRIQGDGLLTQIDGRIRPEILTMESLHPLYVRGDQAADIRHTYGPKKGH